jgi:hypothetical protein
VLKELKRRGYSDMPAAVTYIGEGAEDPDGMPLMPANTRVLTAGDLRLEEEVTWGLGFGDELAAHVTKPSSRRLAFAAGRCRGS